MYEEHQGHRTYHSTDGNATEDEVHHLLIGLLHVIQPLVIVETGTYKGETTKILAQESRFGAIVNTCDLDISQIENPQDLFLPVSSHINSYEGYSVKFISTLLDDTVDFAYLDGGDRVAEAVAIEPKMKRDGMIVMHDSKREIEQKAIRYLRGAGWDVIELPTRRGVALATYRK